MGIRYVCTTRVLGSHYLATPGPEGMGIEWKMRLIFGDLENNSDGWYLTDLKVCYIKNKNRYLEKSK